jgi:hypothetical protein
MRYWAFLSYSHLDAKWGDWLHQALETYRVPRRLVGKGSRDGKTPARLFPIFRDREELPASADLGTRINDAREQSRYLIVVCSPRSAHSRWVGEEIKTFKKLGREDRILALIVEGEPNASDNKPGFRIEDECFHELMRYRLTADGALTSERTEPIAADARVDKDGKTNAKLKLLAGLLDVNYDDLKQREQERRLRRARTAVIAAVITVAIFATLALALFFKQREARTQQIAAERARMEADVQRTAAERSRDDATRALQKAQATASRSELFKAARLIDEGQSNEALAHLSRSIRLNPKNTATLCRLSTLLLYGDLGLLLSQVKLNARLITGDVEWRGGFSPDGKLIATLCPDGVRV